MQGAANYDYGMTDVTLLPIFLAGVASFVLGYLWYHPHVFGAVWMRLARITPETVERGKRQMPVTASLALIANMLIAAVMNYFGIAWGVSSVVGAFELACVCWLGFVAPTMLGMVLWEHRPFTLYALNAGYWLVSFILMAIILLL